MDSETKKKIVIVVLGDPVPKGRPRITKAGATYTPDRTRKWERTAAILAKQQMKWRQPIQGPVRVMVAARFGVPPSWPKKKKELASRVNLAHMTKPDIDNIAKAAVDACNGIVFRDDSQICELVARKSYGDAPLVKIEVTELNRPGSQSLKKARHKKP